MSKTAQQSLLSELKYELSMLREASFTLASVAAIPVIGGPSETDKDIRNELLQRIKQLELQCRLLEKEQTHNA
ncbi:MAG: hypothetical protein R2867_02725 [Caldilineaceae bacterium]